MAGSELDLNLENVTAYLDGRLAVDEKAAFDALLRSDEKLQQEVSSIAAVKTALRHAPRLTAPRNFTLTLQQARSLRRQAVGFPLLRFSSAFTGVAAVFLLAISFVQGQLPAAAPAMMAESSRSVMDQGYTINGEPVIITWGSPYAGGRGGGGGGGDASAAKALDQATVELYEAEVPAPEAPALEAAPLPAPAGSAPMESAAEATAAPALPEITGSGPILGIAPATAEDQLPAVSAARVIPGYWLAAGAAALLSLLFAAGALLIRRARIK